MLFLKRFAAILILFSLLLPLPAHAGEDSAVTRGEFILLLWGSQGGVPFDKTAHPFTDLTEDGQAQAAAWAWYHGLTRGVGPARFAPDRPLTRAECATFLRRLDALWERDTFLPQGPSLCNDYEGVTPWGGDDLYWACITGRMDWRDSRLAPGEAVTYAETARYLSP